MLLRVIRLAQIVRLVRVVMPVRIIRLVRVVGFVRVFRLICFIGSLKIVEVFWIVGPIQVFVLVRVAKPLDGMSRSLDPSSLLGRFGSSSLRARPGHRAGWGFGLVRVIEHVWLVRRRAYLGLQTRPGRST